MPTTTRGKKVVERKLVKHGSSLMISIPSDWIKKNKLTAKDSLTIHESNKEIRFSIKAARDEEIVFNSRGLDRTSIKRLLRAAYTDGADIIKIEINEKEVHHLRNNEYLNTKEFIKNWAKEFIGLEVQGETEKSITLKNYSSTTETANKITKKVFFLLKEYTKLSKEFILQNRSDIESIEKENENLSKYISYGARIINLLGNFDNQKNNQATYMILKQFFLIADLLKYCVRDIAQMKPVLSKKSKNLIETHFETIDIFDNLFFNFKNDDLFTFQKKRYQLRSQVNKELSSFTPAEVSVIKDVGAVLEQYIYLTEEILIVEINNG